MELPSDGMMGLGRVLKEARGQASDSFWSRAGASSSSGLFPVSELQT